MAGLQLHSIFYSVEGTGCLLIPQVWIIMSMPGSDLPVVTLGRQGHPWKASTEFHASLGPQHLAQLKAWHRQQYIKCVSE